MFIKTTPRSGKCTRWAEVCYTSLPQTNNIVTFGSTLLTNTEDISRHILCQFCNINTGCFRLPTRRWNREHVTLHTLIIKCLLFRGATAPSGKGLLIIEHSRTHSDTPHSVGLFWMSDQPDSDTSTWQHTKLTRDRNPYPRGIRTRNPSKRAAAGPRFRLRGHRERPKCLLLFVFVCKWSLLDRTNYRLQSPIMDIIRPITFTILSLQMFYCIP